MKRLIPLFVMAILMSGCASLGHLDKLSAENRQNILSLNIGMSKQEALRIMGNNTATDKYANWEKVTAGNPYKSEILQGENKTFEVIYYLTESKHQKVVDSFGWSQADPVTDDELTPLIFDDGTLIGWGRSFLNENINKYEVRVR